MDNQPFTYELPNWWDCPTWWKQFVYSVDPYGIMKTKDLIEKVQQHLDKWQIIKDQACLICENQDVFCAFVLAYSD